MVKSMQVPLTLLRKVARAADAFAQLENELEDYLLSRDPEFIARMREAPGRSPGRPSPSSG